jgi:hypothetical protein
MGTRDSFLDVLKVPMEKRTDSLLNTVTVATLAIVTAMALKLTDLSFVASLSGATFGTALIFLFPTVMFRKAVAQLGDKASSSLKRERFLSGIIAFLGIAIGGIGTYMTFSGVEF